MTENLIKWLWLIAISIFCITLLSQANTYKQDGPVKVERHQKAPQMLDQTYARPNSSGPGKTYQTRVHITAFSTKECHTSYCNAERNKPRQFTAAVNRNKFGRPRKIYIAVYDRFYDIIGTTDGRTDVDLFFGDDYQGALEFGSKQLLTTFFYE